MGKSMVSSVKSHTIATRIGWHLREIDLRFAPGLPPGWNRASLAQNIFLSFARVHLWMGGGRGGTVCGLRGGVGCAPPIDSCDSCPSPSPYESAMRGAVVEPHLHGGRSVQWGGTFMSTNTAAMAPHGDVRKRRLPPIYPKDTHHPKGVGCLSS